MRGEPDGVMSIGELAEYLKVSRSTLYKLVREGRLPGGRICPGPPEPDPVPPLVPGDAGFGRTGQKGFQPPAWLI